MGIRAYLLLIACLSVLCAPALAEQNIGFINSVQVLTQSDEGKTRIGRWQESFQARQQALQAQMEALQEESSRFAQDRIALTPEQGTAKQRELEAKAKALRRQQEDLGAEAERERNEIIAAISRKMTAIIQEYGRDNAFSVIFQRNPEQQVFVADASDVTRAILDLYNRRHPAPDGNQ